jgi:hypothetical protein
VTFIPNTVPGNLDCLILIGSTWPSTTIEMDRDGVQVIPTSAVLTVTKLDGTTLFTQNATIDAVGTMTLAGLSATATGAFTPQFCTLLFQVHESAVITDLLTGNVTVENP